MNRDISIKLGMGISLFKLDIYLLEKEIYLLYFTNRYHIFVSKIKLSLFLTETYHFSSPESIAKQFRLMD